MTVVKADKITYSSPKSRGMGVSELSFEAEKGGLTVILGSNNSGKTALVRLINALILPDSGKLTICGFDTADKNALRELRKKCAVVFPHSEELFFTQNAAEEMRFSLSCAGLPEKTAAESLKTAAELTGIENIQYNYFSTLSESEIISCAAAVCLVTSPELLIFDNVTSDLTSDEKAKFFKMLAKLTENGISLILTTTDAEDAVYAQKVVLMRGGEKTAEGTAQEILTDRELLQNAHIDPPFAVRVYYDLYDADVKLSKIPLTTGELVNEICR